MTWTVAKPVCTGRVRQGDIDIILVDPSRRKSPIVVVHCFAYILPTDLRSAPHVVILLGLSSPRVAGQSAGYNHRSTLPVPCPVATFA